MSMGGHRTYPLSPTYPLIPPPQFWDNRLEVSCDLRSQDIKHLCRPSIRESNFSKSSGLVFILPFIMSNSVNWLLKIIQLSHIAIMMIWLTMLLHAHLNTLLHSFFKNQQPKCAYNVIYVQRHQPHCWKLDFGECHRDIDVLIFILSIYAMYV